MKMHTKPEMKYHNAGLRAQFTVAQFYYKHSKQTVELIKKYNIGRYYYYYYYYIFGWWEEYGTI